MLKIRNEDLVDVMSFLKGFDLPPKISRVRTKLAKLIQVKVDELYQDEVDLLQKYGKKMSTAIWSNMTVPFHSSQKPQLNITKKRQTCSTKKPTSTWMNFKTSCLYWLLDLKIVKSPFQGRC